MGKSNDVVEIDADEHEERLERVAAIDVAKASGTVCVRLPHRSVPTRRVTKVWEVALPVIERLDEVTGIGRPAAQAIIAEIGLDMTQFPTPGHLVSWAKVTPRTVQSGSRSRGAATGKGNPYLKGVLGEAAASVIGTDTFLGARHRRLVKRTGKLKALVAIERSLLVIVWHLLSDPSARFVDLGSDFYERRINTERKTRDLVRQLQALGHEVTLNPAA